MTTREIEVLGLIKENPQITYPELANRLEVKSTTSIQKLIESLKEKGVIKRIGTYGGYWEIL
ncbi:MAG: HTH domain-containing protein [Bacteroidales bacterium]|nr:HTH domain-containing protein [Bacteroidales bacterium]